MNEIAIKWYKQLGFPAECDEDFYEYARTKSVDEICVSTAVEFLNEAKDPTLSLLFFLSQLDNTQAGYNRKGILQKYFDAAVNRLKSDALACKATTGKLGIIANGWTNGFICRMSHYRINRLDFTIECAVDHWHGGDDIKDGDPISAVHIPGGEPLDPQACLDSFDEAREFFKSYFPEHKFKYFACGSWLLDETLDRFLKPDSNIVKFRSMFTLYKSIESDSAIGHVFPAGTTRENIADIMPTTSLQKKMQEYVMDGGKLYVTFGKIRSNL